MTPSEWLPWMLELMGSWMPLMKEDGCMAIHLGSAVYYRGMPAISSYRERFVVAAQDELGLYRMPALYWEQPARLPNLEWGAVRGHHPRPTKIGRASCWERVCQYVLLWVVGVALQKKKN